MFLPAHREETAIKDSSARHVRKPHPFSLRYRPSRRRRWPVERRPRARPERLHRRPVWLHAVGRPGRGSHQGGTAGWRQPAQIPVHAGSREPRLPRREPLQARRGAGPEAARPARGVDAPGMRSRRTGAQLPPQRTGAAGHRLRQPAQAQPAPGVLRGHRVRRQWSAQGQGRLRPGAADHDRHVRDAGQARRRTGNPVRLGGGLLRRRVGGRRRVLGTV
ncbi:hypothetical protein D3C81_1131390 [compost metagenome]